MRELADYARSRPDAINYASSAAGSTGHLSGELFNRMAKLGMVHIPYKGGGPAMTDLLAGHVPAFVALTSTAVPYIKEGKVRALAVTGRRRSGALMDVPTVAESGYSGYESTNSYCLLGPANLPRAIVDQLNHAAMAVLVLPEIKRALLERGIDPTLGTTAELAAHLKSEAEKWAPIARAAGLQAN